MLCAGVTRFELQPQMKLRLYYGIAEAGSKNLFFRFRVFCRVVRNHSEDFLE